MKSLFTFIKDSIKGGIFFLIPLFTLVVIGNKIWQSMHGVGKKFATFLGLKSIAGFDAAPILSGIIILLFCFFCGLLIRIEIFGWFRNKVDVLLIKYLPGYEFYKTTLEQKISDQPVGSSRPTAIIYIDGVGQAGVIIESLDNGKLVVFIPSKPGTPEGQVYIVQKDAVVQLGIIESDLNFILKHHGKGLASVLNAN